MRTTPVGHFYPLDFRGGKIRIHYDIVSDSVSLAVISFIWYCLEIAWYCHWNSNSAIKAKKSLIGKTKNLSKLVCFVFQTSKAAIKLHQNSGRLTVFCKYLTCSFINFEISIYKSIVIQIIRVKLLVTCFLKFISIIFNLSSLLTNAEIFYEKITQIIIVKKSGKILFYFQWLP